MAASEIVHIAVAPPDKLDEDLILQVASIIDKDVYTTRVLLAGKIPKIIAHYESVQLAGSAAQKLEAEGLLTIVCKNSDLRRPTQKFKAYTMKLDEQTLMFYDKFGQSKQIEQKSVFLTINGRIQTCKKTEDTKNGKKLDLAATVLTGGIPITRRVKEKTVTMSQETEGFIRFYDQSLPEFTVEILQNSFDYSFLDKEMAPFSTLNFGILIRTIRDILPQTVFDDRLTESSATNIPFTAPEESVDINCKLIYLYYKAISNRSSSG